MAQYQVGQLAGGFFYSNVDSGTIPFTRPPDGTWVFTLFLTEFTGAANNQGYTPRDWHNFSSLVTFGAAPGRLSFATSINFGNQLIGTASAIQDTVITNVGGAMVTISGITTTDIVNFQGTSTGCTVLAPGASCTHHTTFTPQSVGAHTAIYEITSNGTGSPQSFVATGSGTNGGSSGVVTLVEYHHASFDHYFITPVAAEIALLDARAPPFEEWSRTGFSFNAYVPSTAPAGAVASCRFFNSHFAPKSSHFYAPHGFGCEATLALFPDWTLEDDKLFSTMLPSGTGACPAGTIPVYRLYNNGAGGAPNHRFTTSLTVRQIMLNQGHTPEGNGIGVSMCVPP